MKYRDMKVKEPIVGSLAPKEEDFMEAWYRFTEERQKITTMLQPALGAIREYHYPRGQVSVMLDNFEVLDIPNKPKAVVITLQCHRNENMQMISFSIPLDACLSGGTAVITFFTEEARKAEERANEAGRKREAADKEERRKKFYELKAEFESLPPIRDDERIEYGR